MKRVLALIIVCVAIFVTLVTVGIRGGWRAFEEVCLILLGSAAVSWAIVTLAEPRKKP